MGTNTSDRKHKTIYVPAEVVEIWDAAADIAAKNGQSLSGYIADALAEHNRRNGANESPASLARRLSAILNK